MTGPWLQTLSVQIQSRPVAGNDCLQDRACREKSMAKWRGTRPFLKVHEREKKTRKKNKNSWCSVCFGRKKCLRALSFPCSPDWCGQWSGLVGEIRRELKTGAERFPRARGRGERADTWLSIRKLGHLGPCDILRGVMQALLEVIKLPEKNANVAHEECKRIVLQKVSSGLVTVWEHVVTYIPTILLH